jgi:hypothetical protein
MVQRQIPRLPQEQKGGISVYILILRHLTQ